MVRCATRRLERAFAVLRTTHGAAMAMRLAEHRGRSWSLQQGFVTWSSVRVEHMLIVRHVAHARRLRLRAGLVSLHVSAARHRGLDQSCVVARAASVLWAKRRAVQCWQQIRFHSTRRNADVLGLALRRVFARRSLAGAIHRWSSMVPTPSAPAQHCLDMQFGSARLPGCASNVSPMAAQPRAPSVTPPPRSVGLRHWPSQRSALMHEAHCHHLCAATLAPD